MKLTIREVAELAGVSVTTVSQILNNKGSRFSQKTRQKVLDIVEEYQYKPDYFASNLINRRSKTIGMIVPDVTDFFFSKVIEGVESYLDPLGYMIVLCNSRHDQVQELRFLEELRHRSVDGILLATPNELPAEYACESAFFKQLPMIMIDRGLNDRDWGRLMVKEFDGAYAVMMSLIERGHRNIGMLRETTEYYKLAERFNGYRAALKDHQLPFKKDYIAYGTLTIDGGYQATKKLLENKELTAIFCSNDEMAMGCYKALYEAGKRVPDDVSVVGFDGLQISEFMVPPLTTVYQPIFDIGFEAAKYLVDAIEFPERKVPNKFFETKLIVRESITSLTEDE